MYGSIFRMRALAGKKDDLIQTMMSNPRTPAGMRAAYLYDTGSDEVWGVAVFDDEASYRANAAAPEQDEQYQKFRALLAADPEWHDGTIHVRPMNS